MEDPRNHEPLTFVNKDGKTVTRANLSIEEMAHLEGLALTTFELRRRQGKGPKFIKIGRRSMCPVANARAYWREQTKQPDLA
jgi:hypothetical protein